MHSKNDNEPSQHLHRIKYKFANSIPNIIRIYREYMRQALITHGAVRARIVSGIDTRDFRPHNKKIN